MAKETIEGKPGQPNRAGCFTGRTRLNRPCSPRRFARGRVRAQSGEKGVKPCISQGQRPGDTSGTLAARCPRRTARYDRKSAGMDNLRPDCYPTPPRRAFPHYGALQSGGAIALPWILDFVVLRWPDDGRGGALQSARAEEGRQPISCARDFGPMTGAIGRWPT